MKFPAIVALLTDFGTRDPYVGAVKGAILAACEQATVVDVVHDLPPHDVLEGALALAAAVTAFPAGTVFLAVVDPGVGSARRGLAVEAGGYRFVGPDNGIFTLVLEEHAHGVVRALTNPSLFRPEVSATFHGRDVFGPVAGRLACGLPLEEVGPPVADPVRLALPPVRRPGPGEWEAPVIHLDRFGNATTSLTARELADVLAQAGGDPTRVVALAGGAVLPLVRTYADVAAGEACALLGSSGRLEVAVNQASAAVCLGLSKGAPVVLRVLPEPGPAGLPVV